LPTLVRYHQAIAQHLGRKRVLHQQYNLLPDSHPAKYGAKNFMDGLGRRKMNQYRFWLKFIRFRSAIAYLSKLNSPRPKPEVMVKGLCNHLFSVRVGILIILPFGTFILPILIGNVMFLIPIMLVTP
jgi:hypothetical protein